MKRLMLWVVLLFPIWCGAQHDSLPQVPTTRESPDQALAFIDYYSQLLEIEPKKEHYDLYAERARWKYELRDFKGAQEDLNHCFQLEEDYCYAIGYQGLLWIELKQRNKACALWKAKSKTCDDEFFWEIETACVENWNYEKEMHVYIKDTAHVLYDEKYNRYYIKPDLLDRENTWNQYFDEELTQIKHRRTRENDTVIKTAYYLNGNKKWQSKKLWHNSHWVGEANWCENGQLLKSYNPNAPGAELVREYYCNGNMQREYFRSKRGYNGFYKEFYENGQLKTKGAYKEIYIDKRGEQKVGLWEYFSV